MVIRPLVITKIKATNLPNVVTISLICNVVRQDTIMSLQLNTAGSHNYNNTQGILIRTF